MTWGWNIYPCSSGGEARRRTESGELRQTSGGGRGGDLRERMSSSARSDVRVKVGSFTSFFRYLFIFHPLNVYWSISLSASAGVDISKRRCLLVPAFMLLLRDDLSKLRSQSQGWLSLSLNSRKCLRGPYRTSPNLYC